MTALNGTDSNGFHTSHTEQLDCEALRQQLMTKGLPRFSAGEGPGTLPGCFRSSNRISVYRGQKLNLTGLDTLKLMGCAQFTINGLRTIIERAGNQPFAVVNLKQENVIHILTKMGLGYIVSGLLRQMRWWTGELSEGNRTTEQIEQSEREQAARITSDGTYTSFFTGDGSSPYDLHEIQGRIDIPVSQVFTERELVEGMGIPYLRLSDKKFGNLDFKHIDEFIEFVKKLAPDYTLLIHCNKGQSRTTLFMIMFDMLRNAWRVSADDIIERQGPRGIGGTDRKEVPKEDDWNHQFKKGWLKFLYLFHPYAAANYPHFEKSWSEWAAEKGIAKFPDIHLGDFYREPTMKSRLPPTDEKETHFPHTLEIHAFNEAKQEVPNFRSTLDLRIGATNMSREEQLRSMYLSGSIQPSKVALGLLLKKLSNKKTQPVVVVDLREGIHLNLNGYDIGIWEPKGLSKRTVADIKTQELALRTLLGDYKTIRISSIMTSETGDPIPRYTMQLPVDQKKIKTTEELVTEMGEEYLRLPNQEDGDIDQLVRHVCDHPKNTWYHFYCETGNEKTTFFMCIFDLLHNADQATVEEIVERQGEIGGVDLRHDQKSISFLTRFHQYVCENKESGFATPWSQWNNNSTNDS